MNVPYHKMLILIKRFQARLYQKHGNGNITRDKKLDGSQLLIALFLTKETFKYVYELSEGNAKKA